MRKAVLGLTKVAFIERWPSYRVGTIHHHSCKPLTTIPKIPHQNPSPSPMSKYGSGHHALSSVSPGSGIPYSAADTWVQTVKQ